MADAKEQLIEYAYNQTVCQQRPACCKPREIDMVMWDADNTIWDISPHSIATNISGKLTKIDDDTVVAEQGGYSSGHKYETVETPKKAPPRKKKKRAWQREFEEELPEWMQGLEEPEEDLDDELAAIEEELMESVGPAPEKPAAKKEDVVELDKVSGWQPGQKKHVEALIKRYGKNRCLVTDVTQEGSVVIDCMGDLYMLTKEGQLITSPDNEPEPVPAKKPAAYQATPRKITIKLLPTFRETLKELEKRGIKSSVISLNSPGSVRRILEAFGLDKSFTEIQDTWENKGKVFDAIAYRQELCPCNAMFVDDTHSHVVDVAKKCGLALQIGKGKDVQKPIEILRYIK